MMKAQLGLKKSGLKLVWILATLFLVLGISSWASADQGGPEPSPAPSSDAGGP